MSPSCPRCARALHPVGTRRQALSCPDGDGLFLDAAELSRALDPSHARALREAVTGSPVPGTTCPGCEELMREVRFEDVAWTADGCPRCGGFWFDGDELARIRDGGLRPWRHAVPDLPPQMRHAAAGVALGLYAFGMLRR